MPQINDYGAPEIQAQQPLGGLSPNVEMMGARGRGLEKLGEGFIEAGSVLNQRLTQKEKSQAYSKVVGLQAQKMVELQQNYGNENFDSQDFRQKFVDDANKIRDSLSTAGATESFDRYASRAAGNLLEHAVAVESQNAYNTTLQNANSDLNTNSAMIRDNPDAFKNILDGHIESLQDQANSDGGKKVAMAMPKLLDHVRNEYATAAIMGYTKMDPGSKEDQTDGAGRKALDSGDFDEYLSPENRKKLEAYVDRAAHGADVANLQQTKAAEQAHKLEYESWGQQAIHKLDSGQLSVRDLDGAKDGNGQPLLKWEEHERWTKMIAEQAKNRLKGNDLAMQGVIEKVNSGDISDPEEVRKYVGPGKLSIRQAGSVISWMNQSPEMKEQTQGIKNVLNEAKATLKTTIPGAQGLMAERYNQFYTDTMQAIKQQKADGKPITDLFNPNSSAYVGIGRQSDKYLPSMQDQMNYLQKHLINTAVTAPEQKNNPNLRKSGESQKDFLDRTRGK